MNNTTITSTEFRAQAGKYIDASAKAPITITKHGRPARVLVDYDHFTSLNHPDNLKVEITAELTEADLEGFDGDAVWASIGETE